MAAIVNILLDGNYSIKLSKLL